MKKLISIILCAAVLFSLASCKGENGGETTIPETTEKAGPMLTLDGGNVEVLSMNSADGIFVEDGRKIDVKQVASIVVQNNSSRMLADAEIWFKVNNEEYASFEVMALPAGEKCVVMEKTARTMKQEDNYVLDRSLSKFAYSDSTAENKNVDVQTEGSTIRITNKTDSTLSTRITYRYFLNGMYYGGIAFTGEFKDIKPGETMEKNSSIFGNDCKIVGVSDNLES